MSCWRAVVGLWRGLARSGVVQIGCAGGHFEMVGFAVGELVGPNGLLNQLTATVLEAALEAEMDEHLGYEKYQAEGRDGGNSRNGRRAKTVLTEIGPVTIEVPRDTESTFEP